MTKRQIAATVLFAAAYAPLTLIIDYAFFTPSIGKTIVATVAVSVAWAWSMKRWHWDKKPATPES